MNFLNFKTLSFFIIAAVFSNFAAADVFNALYRNCDWILRPGGLNRAIQIEKESTPWLVKLGNPDKHDLHIEQTVHYGQCLVLDRQEERGRAVLDRLIQDGNIPSAVFLIKWMEGRVNFDHPEEIQQLIDEYLRLNKTVDSMREYARSMNFPMRLANTYYWLSTTHMPPRVQQIFAHQDMNFDFDFYDIPEIYVRAYFKIPELYLIKFVLELDLEESRFIAGNPPNFYEMFADSASLHSVKSHAEACIRENDTPYFRGKLAFFRDKYLPGCHLLRDTAEALIPLAWQRRRHLRNADCANNLQDCAEYQNLRNQMDMIIQLAFKEPELYLAKFSMDLELEESWYRSGNTQNFYEMFAASVSLHSMKSYATACISANETSFFQQRLAFFGDKYLPFCYLLKDTAEALIPLVEQRRRHLRNPNCANNLQDCAEYQDVRNQMDGIIQSAREDLSKISPQI